MERFAKGRMDSSRGTVGSNRALREQRANERERRKREKREREKRERERMKDERGMQQAIG